jgi:phage terminase large subunit GpA-like protein
MKITQKRIGDNLRITVKCNECGSLFVSNFAEKPKYKNLKICNCWRKK